MPKIEIVAQPGDKAPTITPVGAPGRSTPAQQSAREKAIAALLGQSSQSPMGNSQQTPVQDASKITPEETVNLNKSDSNSGQAAINEAAPEAASAQDASPAAEAAEEPKEATQPETQEEPLSQQYAVLARKEKALRAKEASFKAREAALAAKEAELTSSQPTQTPLDTTKYVSIEELKRNALGILQKHGVSYDDVFQQALQAQSPEFQAMRQMREEIDAKLAELEDKQAKVSKTFEESQTAAYQSALKQIKTDATALVTNDAAYETVKEMGAVQDVVDLIEKTFQEDGVLLTVEEAAAQVEEHLVEEALKLAKLQKIQARLKPATPAPTQAQQTATPAKQQAPAKQMTTLSNTVSTTRQLSARERALLAFKGEKI